MQQRSIGGGGSTQSPRSPQSSQPYLSISVTEPAKMGNGVQAYISYKVITKHIPKINGEIPSMDEVTLDHQRLLDRLQLYELVELKVLGDGNCQFRALSDQIYRTPEHHKFMRQQVAKQLKSHPEIYEAYVPMAYGDYLKKMTKGGEWGDHVTLQAAADSYGLKIFVITLFKDTCYIEILPKVQRSNRVILQADTKCKFDDTLEAHVKMTPDLRRTDLKLIGTASLPHGTGKDDVLLAASFNKKGLKKNLFG